jgi:hypothetical protein
VRQGHPSLQVVPLINKNFNFEDRKNLMTALTKAMPKIWFTTFGAAQLRVLNKNWTVEKELPIALPTALTSNAIQNRNRTKVT